MKYIATAITWLITLAVCFCLLLPSPSSAAHLVASLTSIPAHVQQLITSPAVETPQVAAMVPTPPILTDDDQKP